MLVTLVLVPKCQQAKQLCCALPELLLSAVAAVQNAAVDAANKGVVSSSKTAAVQVAWLRHMACELLHDVPAGQLQEFQLLQLVNFCLKVNLPLVHLPAHRCAR
jgi:hypothetical protein